MAGREGEVVMNITDEMIRKCISYHKDSIEGQLFDMAPDIKKKALSDTNKLIFDSAEKMGVSIPYILLNYYVHYEFEYDKIVREGDRINLVSNFKISLKERRLI